MLGARCAAEVAAIVTTHIEFAARDAAVSLGCATHTLLRTIEFEHLGICALYRPRDWSFVLTTLTRITFKVAFPDRFNGNRHAGPGLVVPWVFRMPELVCCVLAPVVVFDGKARAEDVLQRL